MDFACDLHETEKRKDESNALTRPSGRSGRLRLFHNVTPFFPPTGGCSESLDAFRFFFQKPADVVKKGKVGGGFGPRSSGQSFT